jgi:hypothetical protein
MEHQNWAPNPIEASGDSRAGSSRGGVARVAGTLAGGSCRVRRAMTTGGSCQVSHDMHGRDTRGEAMHAMNERGRDGAIDVNATIRAILCSLWIKKLQVSSTSYICTMISKQRRCICSIHKLVS